MKKCKFNTHTVHADIFQFKSHLRKHEYREKQITAFELGLIDSISEKHSPEWFVEQLAQVSKLGGAY